MPVVNAALIPAPAVGFATDRIGASENPGPSFDGSGNFRTVCDFSHMNFDDPIVYPGQPGRSHLHTYFGNTGANANSTAASIATTGNSTCHGGTVNRSSYWVPSMIDTRDGTPKRPRSSQFYYKTGFGGVVPSTVRPAPLGLRMIAGDMGRTGPGGQYEALPFGYSCHSDSGTYGEGYTIPNCNAGDELWQTIVFPQCWDGVNLDSPDHKSHMAYPIHPDRGCPASHPVPLPEVSFQIQYPVTEANSTMHWRLSSDNYSSSLPGGYSAHGDWFNGWRPDIKQEFVNNCMRPRLDCQSNFLGGGRALY
jgi:hypothetical protein